MNIAFLGTGRMGTELALHLVGEHTLRVWNRTASKTRRLAEAGASVAATPAEAVQGADIVITSLFGPQAVRETVTEPGLIPEGVPWLDTTTVAPADADEFAAAVPTYVGVPVIGTLGPARNGSLGVYVGTPDEQLRQRALQLVTPWADPSGCTVSPRAGKRRPGSCWRTSRSRSAPRACAKPSRWARRAAPPRRKCSRCCPRPVWPSSPA